jgi:hypothetical protein
VGLWAGLPDVGVARVEEVVLRLLVGSRIHGAGAGRDCSARRVGAGSAWSPRFLWRARRWLHMRLGYHLLFFYKRKYIGPIRIMG